MWFRSWTKVMTTGKQRKRKLREIFMRAEWKERGIWITHRSRWVELYWTFLPVSSGWPRMVLAGTTGRMSHPPVDQPVHFLMAIVEEPETKQKITSIFSVSTSIMTANIPWSTVSHKAKPSVKDGTECKHRVEITATLHGKGHGYNEEMMKLGPLIQSVYIML